ncbi:type III PLP-dependent enzyme [Streptomyces sp. LBUM 1476]|uniref:Type III PLP-dependent enzyme n=1 Tax=Streptomyces acidiscabies TaxID=42234 RepID=A0AAP6ECK1_9ACTN|nr:type III PLP-dependent enzyme [Streptomyces acidiscabies]MBP5941580.1 type III PLP-dependent enzyme [Streptomyces sp. LBUM 1476]MBZ3912972.1 type III PLP-dependent enzyme [Streptomyces acidiscabies]MDX2958457.1 type III PLP-dependent enzyme [Streptomyces acidiscabies]MDX3021037.1 type III PLP-dependent enzyme [Streptomyces acidiscabies]MDX3794960.1 type III PLP-dependent enzyme [Streptomyces acidiscabies]
MNRVHEYALGLSAGELPSYVYDLAALREHAAAVRDALPSRVEVYYAAKANPEAEILAALGAYVDGYEVSSGGELAHVARAVPGRALAFGGPGKTPDEVRAALDAGVERFHVESEYELAMLAALAGGRRVSVLPRVNLAVPDGALTGSQLAMGGRPTPFGMDPSRAAAVARGLASGAYGNLELVGVHAHLASGLDAEAQVAVAGAVVEWATGIGVPLTEVNVGGGMAVDYRDPESRFDWVAYGKGLGEIADAHPELTLRIEPGRALTAYCGWYVTEVLDVKRSHGEEFAVVRGGTHHLRTPATKGHDQPCVVLPVEEWAYPWPRAAASGELVTLAGQLCTPKDLLARGVPAGGVRAGDRVAFSMAGAYAWNISHHEFLMHPRPGFHFLR